VKVARSGLTLGLQLSAFREQDDLVQVDLSVPNLIHEAEACS
jgi:hypothetical protein